MATDVAVCYSGWLNVSLPQGGATAHAALIAPWSADVLVAATHKNNECSTVVCLRRVLAGLGPLRAARVDRMLDRDELLRLMESAPIWRTLTTRFVNASASEPGVHWASPLLGNPKLSVLRQLHDYNRVHALLRQHEQARGRSYTRIIHSRLEFLFLAPHPPPRLLPSPPRMLWVPSGESYSGVNDRHAVMGRSVVRAPL